MLEVLNDNRLIVQCFFHAATVEISLSTAWRKQTWAAEGMKPVHSSMRVSPLNCEAERCWHGTV